MYYITVQDQANHLFQVWSQVVGSRQKEVVHVCEHVGNKYGRCYYIYIPVAGFSVDVKRAPRNLGCWV